MTLSVIQHPSPNHDERREAIDMLVLHYTGMQSATAALERMCDEEASVSAHYMIDEDGSIYQLVAEEQRAWHAGISYWQGQEQLNHCSIGIEIVNPGHEFGYRTFPETQMNAVTQLCQDILARYPIPAHRVVAHSDIAPGRKEDPGELFDWPRLARHQIGCFPALTASPTPISLDSSELQILQAQLKAFGYQLPQHGEMDQATIDAIIAFKRHYYPEALDNSWDAYAQAMLDALVTMRNA